MPAELLAGAGDQSPADRLQSGGGSAVESIAALHAVTYLLLNLDGLSLVIGSRTAAAEQVDP